MQGDPLAVGLEPGGGFGDAVLGAFQADGAPQGGEALQGLLEQLADPAAEVDQGLGGSGDLVEHPVPVLDLAQPAGVGVPREGTGLDLDGGRAHGWFSSTVDGCSVDGCSVGGCAADGCAAAGCSATPWSTRCSSRSRAALWS